MSELISEGSLAVAGALVSVASWDLGSILILAGQMCLVECLRPIIFELHEVTCQQQKVSSP